MKDTVSTRISGNARLYYIENYKNIFSAARLFLEAIPILREETKLALNKVLTAEELSFIVTAHKGEKFEGKELASRRSFESFLADYWEQNATYFGRDIDFSALINKIRDLSAFERFILRELAYGIHTNPKIKKDDIDKLLF